MQSGELWSRGPHDPYCAGILVRGERSIERGPGAVSIAFDWTVCNGGESGTWDPGAGGIAGECGDTVSGNGDPVRAGARG